MRYDISDALGIVMAGLLIVLILVIAFVAVPLCGIAMLWFIEDILGKDVDAGVYWAGIGVLSVYALIVVGIKNKKEDD